MASYDSDSMEDDLGGSPSGLDSWSADSESYFRLHEAIKLTILRTEGDGEHCSVDDVTRVSETDNLVNKEDTGSTELTERCRIGLLVVSWLSMFVLGGLGSFTFVISIREKSNASFAFALDAFLVCLSSVVLIWRYTACGDKPTTFSTKKEKISCIFLGALFYVSALGVIIRSLMSLIQRDKPDSSDIMWKIFIVNAVCCAGFAAGESYLATKLESTSIAMDAINTGLGAVLSLSGCISDVIFIHSRNVSIWYIDAVIGVVCGVIMIIYATWAMAHVVFKHI